MPQDENAWSEYAQLVLFRLDEQAKEIRSIKGELSELKMQYAIFKTKILAYGSAVATIVTLLINIALRFWRG